jgi:hypothetical protein
MSSGFFFGVLVGWTLGLWFRGWMLKAKSADEPDEPSALDSLDLTPRHPGGAMVNLDGGEMGRGPAPRVDFAVTGTPRHIPWSRRKKELEQAARQKRRQLESLREEA